MIGPGALRRTVEKNLSKALAGDKSALTACVGACAAYKIKLVAKDERDERGIREQLNLGHTAGHAFEALAGGRMAHGEAVARGLRFTLILSALANKLPSVSFDKLDALVTALRLPAPPKLRRDFRKFLALVSKDKKARGARNRFILVKGPGRLEAAENINPALLKKAFDGALK